MTESEKSFADYLDEVIEHAGQTGKRRTLWSIPRCVLARQVWGDCMERQNVARDTERDKQYSPSGT